MEKMIMEVREMNRLMIGRPNTVWEGLERWFEAPFAGFEQIPPVDVEETDDAFKVTAELPGFDKGEIEVELQDNLLTIRGEKTKEEGRRFLRRERTKTVTRFERRFLLPREIDQQGTTARFEKGELLVTIPKAATGRARKIELN